MTAKKKTNKANGRDYTYDTKYQASAKQRKRRSDRTAKRAQMKRDGTIKKGETRDLDHKDKNPANKSKSNLRLISKKKNRAEGGKLGKNKGTPAGRKKKTTRKKK